VTPPGFQQKLPNHYEISRDACLSSLSPLMLGLITVSDPFSIIFTPQALRAPYPLSAYQIPRNSLCKPRPPLNHPSARSFRFLSMSALFSNTNFQITVPLNLFGGSFAVSFPPTGHFFHQQAFSMGPAILVMSKDASWVPPFPYLSNHPPHPPHLISSPLPAP